jgi:hypothetical protein
MSEKSPWPKLSETCRFENHPESCKNCGQGIATGLEDTDLLRWQECDENDKTTSVVVILCRACSDKLIEPHPRLYSELPEMGPFPGIMPMCVACKLRKGITCTSPLLTANGGPGMHIRGPQPDRGFWDGTKNGKRVGGMFVRYPHHPRECEGREVFP